ETHFRFVGKRRKSILAGEARIIDVAVRVRIFRALVPLLCNGGPFGALVRTTTCQKDKAESAQEPPGQAPEVEWRGRDMRTGANGAKRKCHRMRSVRPRLSGPRAG